MSSLSLRSLRGKQLCKPGFSRESHHSGLPVVYNEMSIYSDAFACLLDPTTFFERPLQPTLTVVCYLACWLIVRACFEPSVHLVPLTWQLPANQLRMTLCEEQSLTTYRGAPCLGGRVACLTFLHLSLHCPSSLATCTCGSRNRTDTRSDAKVHNSPACVCWLALYRRRFVVGIGGNCRTNWALQQLNALPVSLSA